MKPEKMLDGVRHIYDVSSLSSLKRCFQYFHYKENLGAIGKISPYYRPRLDGAFGTAYHECTCVYNNAVALGESPERALHKALYVALTIYRNFIDSDNTTYTLENLCRTLVWYDQFYSANPFTIAYLHGTPILETRFELPLKHKRLSGYLDGLIYMNGQLYILERKTRGKELTEDYLNSYAPNIQTYGYVYAFRKMGIPVAGVIVEIAAVLVNSTRFRRLFFDFVDDDKRLDEWEADVLFYTSIADNCYRTGYWPKNENACGAFGGTCQYHYLCSAPPDTRPALLLEATIYAKNLTDPKPTLDPSLGVSPEPPPMYAP